MRNRAGPTAIPTPRPTAIPTAAPTITFLGHAGFDVRHAGVRLLVDPWLGGTAFDDGWSLLLPPPPFDPSGITHLWISHEHPDHFSPSTLRLIPSEARPAITVVLQQTSDHRVAEYFRAHGFGHVHEVDDGAPFELRGLDGSVAGTLTTAACAMGDSAFLLDLGGVRVLNTNDCGFADDVAFDDTLRMLDAESDIDLLLCQFSYANWVGDPCDVDERRAYARHKLDLLLRQVRRVRPRHTFPCASFVVFAHEENLYLNDAVNDFGATCREVDAAGSIAIAARPGVTSTLDDAGFAAMREDVDGFAAEVAAAVTAARNGSRPPLTSTPVGLDELQTLVRDALGRLRSGTSGLDAAIMRRQLPRAVFEIRDAGRLLVIDRLRDVRVLDAGSMTADVSASSSALAYAFRHDFGFETLLINGRFQTARPGGRDTIKRLTGQFGYLRRHECLAASIVRRRVLAPLRRLSPVRRGSASRSVRALPR